MSLTKKNEKISFRTKVIIFNLIVLSCFLIACNTFITITNNSYEKIKVLINMDDYENKEICSILIEYPSINGMKNKGLQNNINNQLKSHFLADTNTYCFENNQDDVWLSIEKRYNFYISNNLLSIISNELISSNIVAGNTIKDYNIDLKTGTFLTLKDLFILEYKDEIVKIVLDDIFLNPENPNSRELYEYYLSIKEDVFYRFHIQIQEKTIIFMFKGTSNVEPIYKSEILKSKIKKYINKKYI